MRKPLCFVMVVMMAASLAVFAADKSAEKTNTLGAPSTIECLTVEIDGETLHQELTKPIPVENEKAVRHAYQRFGLGLAQKGLDFGDEKSVLQGVRIAQTVLDGGTYVAGRVCYVSLEYCSPNCWGNGCATIRVPSIK